MAAPSMPPHDVVRKVQVGSSRRREGKWVVLAAAVIALGVLGLVAFERRWGSSSATQPAQPIGLLPFQVLFRDLPDAEQRIFRQMQEGAIEAVVVRGSSGAWPSVTALAGQGVPPFASDSVDRFGYRWNSRSEGLLFEYIGVPSRMDRMPVFMIMIQEPDAETGERYNPKLIDEEHQLLPDRTLVHVTYWKRPSDPQWLLGLGMIRNPAERGWLQIRLADPAERPPS